jgi:plasmid maintenance system antidote protein VapI
MNNKNEKDLLFKISEFVKDHIQNKMNERLSTLSVQIGVSHPTSSKILNPGKENAGGVAIKYLIATLSHCNILDEFIKEIESKARKWHSPIEPINGNCPEEGLQRLTWLARSFSTNERLNVNCIGHALEVSHNTAKAMVHYSDNSGGVSVKSWLALLRVMDVDIGLSEMFTKNMSQTVDLDKIPTTPTRKFDLGIQPSVY